MIGDYKYTADGEVIRVVIANDVISLPGWSGNAKGNSWSMAHFGFGCPASLEWMLHSGDLPGNKARRELLARVIVRATEDHCKAIAESVKRRKTEAAELALLKFQLEELKARVGP